LKDYLLFQIRPDRQTLYWSATWPKEVEQLARNFLFDPYKVIIVPHEIILLVNILHCSILPYVLLVSKLQFYMMQVIIGSEELKANHAISQHVEILSESQKYNK
jgi:ATP-dependent RNA helicase DDX5/DBP2